MGFCWAGRGGRGAATLCAARAALGWDHAGTWVTLVRINGVLHALHTLYTFLEKRVERIRIFFFPPTRLNKKIKNLRPPQGLWAPKQCAKLANPASPSMALCALAPRRQRTTPPAHTPGTRAGRGHERAPPALPAHDAPAEHVRVPPQGPLEPPAPRGPRVEPRGARAGHNRALRVAQAVPGSEAHRVKMGDVHAGHAL